MSLGKQLVERLKLLGGEGAAQHLIQVSGAEASYYSAGTWLGAQRAVVEFCDHDRYSVTLRALEVGAAPVAPDHVQEYLSERAATIARRLGYLEEPLAVWELNALDGAVQLRSSPPHRDGDERGYWEVLLRLSDQPCVRLTRYTWHPGAPDRRVVEYPATFSLLGRIADDLVAALAE